MMRSKSADLIGGRRRWWMKPSHLLLAAAALYLLFISSKFRRFVEITIVPFPGAVSSDHFDRIRLPSGDQYHRELENSRRLPRAHDPLVFRAASDTSGNNENNRDASANYLERGYGRITGEVLRRYSRTRVRRRSGNFSEFERSAQEAWALGLKAWAEAQNYSIGSNFNTVVETERKPCPLSMSISSNEVKTRKDLPMLLPCGLAVGSAITVVGTPNEAHAEYVPQLARMHLGDGTVMVSQFMVELQGLRAVDGEDPPKILHLNPRLKGDWSERPVIEHNTCYRMQWGKAMRCDGLPSKDGDETVDGFSKCEKWERDDDNDSKGSKTTSWLNRFIGRAKKPEMTWPFPFAEGKLFILTIQAGVEGFHIYIGGRHVSSFPFRTGFTLQDATGLEIKGNVDIHSVYATSLPISHPSFSLQQALEMSKKWKAPPLPEKPVHLFIGILSATNHFAERMAIRKSWMQYPALRSSYAVARFFVALSQRKEVNAALKKEAEYFNDIVILPFVDRYELVVLKTIAICEYGARNLTASYIMKCDDDTFVRVDVMLKEIDNVAQKGSIYIGNINYLHRPLRSGKWAVTYEEWPEDIYPPYANGPGYIISSDIARFIVSQHANQSLRLFKMEDVSMGMWVEDFNTTAPVHYLHNWKFCQYGCMENYYTSHYQSPRQMLCLWDKLSHGQAHCCNFR